MVYIDGSLRKDAKGLQSALKVPCLSTSPIWSLKQSWTEWESGQPGGVCEGTHREEEVEQVLKDWCPVFRGFFLCYPSRRNHPASLSALIETLRFTDYFVLEFWRSVLNTLLVAWTCSR